MMEMSCMQKIEKAIEDFNREEKPSEEKIAAILEQIRIAVNDGAGFIVPVIPDEDSESRLEEGTLQRGKVITCEQEKPFTLRSLKLNNGQDALAVFTSEEELEKGEPTAAAVWDAGELLEYVTMTPNLGGFVINPWGNAFLVVTNFIEMIYNGNLPAGGENTVHIGTADITGVETDCIVNAANRSLLGGGGVDGAIHRAAGPELLAECRQLGGCETGRAKITQGYRLPADYIIHTVGPVYSGSREDARLLYACYWNCLELARENRLHSIAFPAISTGAYGYPLEEATDIACRAVTDWCRRFPDYGMDVFFACFDEQTEAVYLRTYEKLNQSFSEREFRDENDGFTLEKALSFVSEHHK